MPCKASANVTIADISDGTDGTGIASTKVEYQAGSSGTSAPTGTWSTSIPATSASAPYLWTRVTYTYTDGSSPKIVYSVGSTPEGIEVGGRNLIKNSNFTNGVTGWATDTGTSSVVSDSVYTKHLEFVLTVLCFLFCIAYIIQFVVFPKVLFQGAMVDGLDVELRFRLTGQCLGTISFLMGVNKLFIEYSTKHLGLMLCGLIVTLIVGFRSQMLALVIVTFFMFVRVNGIKLKAYGKYI